MRETTILPPLNLFHKKIILMNENNIKFNCSFYFLFLFIHKISLFILKFRSDASLIFLIKK